MKIFHSKVRQSLYSIFTIPLVHESREEKKPPYFIQSNPQIHPSSQHPQHHAPIQRTSLSIVLIRHRTRVILSIRIAVFIFIYELRDKTRKEKQLHLPHSILSNVISPVDYTVAYFTAPCIIVLKTAALKIFFDRKITMFAGLRNQFHKKVHFLCASLRTSIHRFPSCHLQIERFYTATRFFRQNDI